MFKERIWNITLKGGGLIWLIDVGEAGEGHGLSVADKKFCGRKCSRTGILSNITMRIINESG